MKDKIITFMFLSFIFIFLILNIVLKKESVSYEERRYLKQMPTISLVGIKKGKYFKELDQYIEDNFVFRKLFRKVNVLYNFNILRKGDYKGYYIDKGYVFKREKINRGKINSFSDKMNNLYDKYLVNSNVYYSIIPDKGYYNGDDSYDEVVEIVSNNINKNIKFIDISKCLKLDSYYYSDIHWKQDKILKVSDEINFNLGVSSFNEFNKNYYNNFLGSYYGSVSGISKKDKIVYLDNDVLNNVSIYDVEGKINSLYQIDKFGGMDSYDVFLGGATPLIRIDNNDTLSNRELIIFRDSFGSSIAPLLLKDYKSITLIDLRYIDSNLIGEYVEFEKKDVLLLYNTTIINNSDIIK